MGKGFRLKHMKVLDGQDIDLAAHGLAVGGAKCGDGWILFPLSVRDGEARIHFTVLIHGGRLTIHATNQETNEHAHLISLDLTNVVQKVCNPAFLEAYERRLRQMYYQLHSPESLASLGTSRLQPMLVNEDAYRLLPGGTLEALSPLPSTDLTKPWSSSSDFAWIAFDGRDEPIGVAYPRWGNGQVYVFFVYFEDMEKLHRWLAVESGLSEAISFRQQLRAERQLRRLKGRTSQ